MSKTTKPKGKAKGPVPARTARMRYVEPATKKDGNPFFALRVPGALLRAFKAEAKRRKSTPTELARELFATAAGYEHEEGGDE